MILITTSRKPSRNTRVFARKLGMLLPDSIYLTRGKRSVESLAEYAVSKGLSKIAVIEDKKGNPNKISFINVTRTSWAWDKTILMHSVSFKPFKQKFNDINYKSKQFKDWFLVEPSPGAALNAEVDDKITFKIKDEVIMTIKLEE